MLFNVDAYPDRIRIGIKMMPILMRILPQVTLMLENPNFYKNFKSQRCQFTMFYLSRECQTCHNFEYFGRHIEIFWEKSIAHKLFHISCH